MATMRGPWLKSDAPQRQILKCLKWVPGHPFEDISPISLKSVKSLKSLYGADMVTGCLARSIDTPCERSYTLSSSHGIAATAHGIH